MQHKFPTILLLIAILWESLTMVGSWSGLQQVGDLQHLIVHGQDVNHHHHMDNALQMDDDGGPVQHMHADTGNSSAALLASQQPALADVGSISPPDMTYAVWLSPTLEGPLRPPMPRA